MHIDPTIRHVRQTGRVSALALIALIALVGTHQPVHATPSPAPHKIGESYIFLKIFDDVVAGRLEIPVKNLNEVLGLSLADPQAADTAELAPHMDKILSYLGGHVDMKVNGADVQLTYGDFTFRHIEIANYLMLEFVTSPVASIPKNIEVRFDPFFDNYPRYKGLLVVEENFRTGTFENYENVALIFTPGNRVQTLDLTRSSLWTGFVAFVQSGVWHIWIGFDHILFLMALILPSVLRRKETTWEATDSFKESFWNVVKIVTLFTIAHSVTLALASLEVVSLPSRLVESIIAASVAVAAIDILYPVLGRRILIVVFLFGLFHGFGFASNLTHIGLDGTKLVLALVGFNVGVELGQIGIIAVVFPVLFAIRRTWLYRRVLLPAGAGAFIIIATFWFVERAFDVNIPVKSLAQSIVGG